MQETYSVSVKTADGKSLIDAKIIGDLFALLHQSEDIERSKTLLGGGTGPYQPVSSSSTGR
jgi:hypothetical protein